MTPIALIHPLAKGDPIIGIIFFVIWGIIVLMSAYQKYQQKQRKGPGMQLPPLPQQPPTMPSPPVPPPLPPVLIPQPQRQAQPIPRMPPKPRPVSTMPQRQPKAKPAMGHKPLTLPRLPSLKKAPVPPAKKPLPKPVAQIPTPEAAAPVHDAYDIHASTSMHHEHAVIGGQGASAKHVETPPAVTSNELASLLRPDSLRKYYILAELLREPVGLRADHR